MKPAYEAYDSHIVQEAAMGKDQIKGINRNPRMLNTAPPGAMALVTASGECVFLRAKD